MVITATIHTLRSILPPQKDFMALYCHVHFVSITFFDQKCFNFTSATFNPHQFMSSRIYRAPFMLSGGGEGGGVNLLLCNVTSLQLCSNHKVVYMTNNC